MKPYEATEAERKLAEALLTATVGLGSAYPNDVAFIVVDVPNEAGGTHQIVWVAESHSDCKPWNSAVVKLVLGVREASSSADVSSHKWMRNRILTTAQLTDLDKAVVKVCASKAAVVAVRDEVERDDDAETNVNALSPSEAVNMSSKDDGDNLLSLPRYDANHWAEYAVKRGIKESRDVLPAEIDSIEKQKIEEDDERLFNWASAFINARLDDNLDENIKPKYESNRNVIAMLVGKNGELLDCAVNTNSKNQVLHAEFNLLAKWLDGFGGGTRGGSDDDDEDDDSVSMQPKSKLIDISQKKRHLPPGSRLLITLQCCRMCAALVCAASDDSIARDDSLDSDDDSDSNSYYTKNPHDVPLLDVVYLDEDVGNYSNATELQKRNRERIFLGNEV